MLHSVGYWGYNKNARISRCALPLLFIIIAPADLFALPGGCWFVEVRRHKMRPRFNFLAKFLVPNRGTLKHALARGEIRCAAFFPDKRIARELRSLVNRAPLKRSRSQDPHGGRFTTSQ